MDPLSAISSIIAVFQAGGMVSKGLKKVLNLQNAPDILLALNNEVADLQGLLGDINAVLRQHREITEQEPIGCLNQALEKANRTLLKLENLLAYELTTTRGKDNELRLDRSVWLRCERSVQNLKDEIRQDKISLSSALSVLTSATSLRSDARIREMYILLGTMKLEPRDDRNVAIEAAPQAAAEITDSSEQSLIQYSQAPHAGQGTDSDSVTVTSIEQQRSFRQTSLANTASAKAKERSYTGTLKNAPNFCGPNCNCTCHQTYRLRSPGFLDGVIGSLFVGYRASPWFSQECRNGRCWAASVRIHYAFPGWFVKRAVAMTIACSQPRGPELLLRVLRVRPSNTPIFICARQGYCDQLKRLLANGQASVVDTDTNNQTALIFAMIHEKFEVADLLIQEGSDLSHEDDLKNQLYTLAWLSYLKSKVRGQVKVDDRMLNLVGGRSQFDSLNFSELHNAYLQPSRKTFDRVLRSIPRDLVDQADAFGRTTLHWAARGGDWRSVDQLLRCGADPNKADYSGYSSLHVSILGEDSRCLELVLAAKVDVHLKDVYGLTALHFAAKIARETRILDILLSFGVDIEATDRYRRTPLDWAAFHDNHLMLAGLLERGADANARDYHGWNILSQAIFRNSHNVLRMLLANTSLRYNVKTDDGQTLLHLAALHADIETLNILRSKRLYELDSMEKDDFGWTAMNYAKEREFDNEGWSTWLVRPCDHDPTGWGDAFRELVDDINNAQDSIAEYGTSEASEDQLASEGSFAESEDGDDGEEEEDGVDEEEKNHDHNQDQGQGQDEDNDEIDDEDEGLESWEDAVEDLDGSSQR